jgi:hypothetical protein
MRRATNIGAVHRLDDIVQREGLDLSKPGDCVSALLALSDALRNHCSRKAVRRAAHLSRHVPPGEAARALALRTLRVRTGASAQ